MAEDLFGDMVPSTRLDIAKASFAAGSRREVKNLEQAHFTFALEGPGYRDDDFYAAQIFSTAFGGGMSSRLFQEAREKRGLCYTVFSQIGSYSDTGMMTIYAGTSGEDIGGLGDLCVDELKRASEDMSETEIARARAQMKAGLLMGLESPSSRSERMARVVDIWGRVPSITETIEKIDVVDVHQVRAFAEKMISQQQAAMALYGPVEKARSLDELTRRMAA